MTKYFIDGEEVSRDVAEGILATNDLIMKTGKFEEMINIKFVAVVNVE